jgi:DNA-binding SARP family transcriptional activator/Tfp pilus assembly protein PilF
MSVHPLAGRVTLVRAAAGWGKTTAVRAWLTEGRVRWLRGGDLGADTTLGAGVTVVDDLHLAPPGVELPVPGDGGRLVAIGRAPARLWRGGVLPAEIGPARLALSAGRVAQVLAQRYAVRDAGLAALAHRLTAGWPGLVHLVGMTLADGTRASQLSRALTAPGTAGFEYLRTEVLEGLHTDARRLLSDCAHLDAISVPLAAALGHRRAGATVADLARLGLLDPPVPGHAWYRLVPLVAAASREWAPRSNARRRRVLSAATRWHRRNDRLPDALRLAVTAGDHAACVDLLRDHGPRLLASGAATAVARAVSQLPGELRDPHTELLLAEAREITGDASAALELYARLADGDGPLPPALAWRYGAAVYLWGDGRDALRVLRRGALSTCDTADEALLLGWTAAAFWLAGDVRECRAHARRAHEVAVAARDDRALANAHVALALCANLTGDPAETQTHYERALRLADAAGDPVLVTRVRANLASCLERQGRHAEALELLRPALELATRTAHAGMLAMALCNKANLLRRTGRLDDAAVAFDRSIEIYQKAGSRKVAYALNGLGDLHRERGRSQEAESCYRQALRAASAEANRQGLVPALAGLARTVAADRPALAGALSRRALRHATALAAAGRQRDRAGLADALELRAASGGDPAQARQALTEALAIWRDTAASVDADRVRVALGALPQAQRLQVLEARLAADRLRAAGVALPAPSSPPPGPAPAPVEIRVLGGFALTVGGAPVPPAVWCSRKARDLLRILVARRGQPVAREELARLLWPGDDASEERVGHRLSVALSTVRGVLDPGRCAPPDHFLAADQATVALALDRVTVDVETFLATARHGLHLTRTPGDGDARAVLAAAERAFTGEVYAGEPYDEWARPLREEARATYLHVLRELATVARRAGEPDTAVRYLLGSLAIDPYDERSHRGLVDALVGACRFGEAMRARDRYAEAMRELGLTPADVRGLPAGPRPDSAL